MNCAEINKKLRRAEKRWREAVLRKRDCDKHPHRYFPPDYPSIQEIACRNAVIKLCGSIYSPEFQVISDRVYFVE